MLGSEPQIFFYANRRSATGHIYVYALMEDHDFAKSMQEEMIREIEASNPRMLVFVQVGTSWLRRRESQRLIFDWFSRYRRRFDLTTVVKLQRSGAQYYHAEGLSKLKLRPPFIEIYTRRE